MTDLSKPISEMSDAELLERVRSLRREKFEVRPSKQKREATPAKKEKKAIKLSLNRALQGMSVEELEAIQQMLIGGEE